MSSRWGCLASCFAYMLELEESKLFELVGHNGSEVMWPEKPFPLDRRGFHPQEMLRLCLTLNKPCYYMECNPAFEVNGQVKNIFKGVPLTRILDLMGEYSGVLAGILNGKPHAMCWDHRRQVFIDPGGVKKEHGLETVDLEVDYFCVMKFPGFETLR